MSDPTVSDRILKYFRQLVRAEFPQLTFLGTYEYAVQSVAADGSTADIVPTDTSIGLPNIPGVPLVSSILGETAKAAIGVKCRLIFLNGSPTRPKIIGVDPTPQKATVDATIELDLGPSAAAVKIAGGGAAVARAGDPVTVQTAIAGTVSGATCSITAAQLATAGLQIQSGSSKVSSG